MKISKITLIKDGYGGISIAGEIPKEKGNLTIRAKVKGFEYKIPLPIDLQQFIKKMRKYILDIYGYWKPEYDQFLLRGNLIDTDKPTDLYFEVSNLLRTTFITGIEIKVNAVVLSGHLLNKQNIILPLNPPGINFNDGYDKYDKMLKGANMIFSKVNDFIEDKTMKKMESKQYMIEFYADDPEKLKQIESLDKEELDKLMVNDLEEKGYIILHNKEISDEDTSDQKPDDLIDEKVDISDVDQKAIDDGFAESVAVEENIDDETKTDLSND